MRRPRTALALAVVATVLLAGCFGGILGGTDATTTPTTGDATATPTGTTTGDGPSADAVRDAAVDAIGGVETYAFEGRLVQEYREAINVTSTSNTTGVVDRANRRLRVNETQTSGDRTYAVETYVLNETVYSHSEFYSQDYGSEWIRRSPANFSGYFETTDTLARQRTVLRMANVSLVGTETIDGTETRVLNATVPPAEYERLVAETLSGVDGVDDVTVESATFRFYVATDTDRPVRSNATVEATLTVGGQAVTLSQRLTVDYTDYGGTVAVTLPEGAEDAAVAVSES